MSQNNIILKSVYGSHLFGLNTPESDNDYYVIFKANLEDIILKKDSDCWTENDNNTQNKEMRKFLRDAMSGQTYAIELLFSPNHFHLTSSDTWSEIVANRDKLISKNLRPFLGYAQGQAKKYTGRRENFSELSKVLDVLKKYPSGNVLADINDMEFSDKIYRKQIKLGNGKTDEYIRFFHKDFPINAKLSIVVSSIQKYVDEYGDRTRFYASKQYDCKAFSHAIRLCYMLDELMTTGKISMPVVNRDYLLRVKLGEVGYDEVQTELDRMIRKIDCNINILPDEPDYSFWEKFIIEKYLRETS